MKCPECKAKITAKHFDAELEMYECPKCEGIFTADEIEEAETGTSPRKRAAVPVAKGKRRRTEIQEDDEALAEHEKKALTPVKVDKGKKHRDEVPTSQILNIMADEIEEITAELGGKVDRLNAREFYAMNLWRPLAVHAGVSAREATIEHKLCKRHAA